MSAVGVGGAQKGAHLCSTQGDLSQEPIDTPGETSVLAGPKDGQTGPLEETHGVLALWESTPH